MGIVEDLSNIPEIIWIKRSTRSPYEIVFGKGKDYYSYKELYLKLIFGETFRKSKFIDDSVLLYQIKDKADWGKYKIKTMSYKEFVNISFGEIL